MLDLLFGLLLPEAGNGGLTGFLLLIVQLLILVVQIILVGRTRRHRLEAERYSIRAEERSGGDR